MTLTNLLHTDINSLLKVMYTKYGYDFRGYSENHILRRVVNRLKLSSLGSVVELEDKISNDVNFAALFLQDLSINVTEMFRDPDFYKSLRELVIPILKTYPFIKIWHAGCSTGEEVYSLAIILKEEGLYNRATIYATDFNQSVLNRAKEGIFSNKAIKEYSHNYYKSGGTSSFSDYYSSNYDMAIMRSELKKNIVWAHHNLVTDNVFSEMHLILCRNVLIYFQPKLQNRVHQLFYDSLVSGGILCLGKKESFSAENIHHQYIKVHDQFRICKKKY